MLCTDFVKIEQILINLISNACKFTQNGQITLATQIYKKSAENWLDISVSDTGIGLTAEQIKKLFKPFIQADASTTRQYGGTGLGLAISKHFAEMLKGDLRVESEKDVGSRFILSLPMVLKRSETTNES